LSRVNIYSNNLFVARDSKQSHISSKLVQEQQTYKNNRFYRKQIALRTQTSFSAAVAIKNVSLIGNCLDYQLPSPTVKNPKSKKINGLGRENKKLRFYAKSKIFIKKQPSLLLSPKLITSFISALLQKSANAKYGMDTSNLSVSIPLLLTKLLTPYKDYLLGVKVICSGR
jgi:hypothetical protein